MELFPLLLVALSLSADCFAVALSASIARGVSFSRVFRLAFSFGFFQFLMPILGWLAGRTIVEVISSFDHWLAFLLLALIGGKMVLEVLRSKGSVEDGADITRGVSLITLSVATSLDALAVGLSFAFVGAGIIAASATIGVVAFGVTTTGFLLGKKVGRVVGARAKLVGGLILIGIGIRVLITHLM